MSKLNTLFENYTAYLLKDFLLVERDVEHQVKTNSAFDMGETLNNKNKPRSGKVILVSDALEKISVGDTVFFTEFSGFELKIDETLEESPYLVLREDEVLLALRPKAE